MTVFGNVFLAIGGFVIFLSIAFYFVGLTPHQIVVYPYRSEAPLVAVLGFILVAIGIIITFIEYKKTGIAKTPRVPSTPS